MYTNDSLVHLKFDHLAAQAAALPDISGTVSNILTQQFKVAMTNLIAIWECSICSVRSILTRFMKHVEDSPVYLNVVELWFLDSILFKIHVCLQVCTESQIYYSQIIASPSLHYSQHTTYASHPKIGQPRNYTFRQSTDHITYASLIVLITNAFQIPCEPYLM